MTMTTIQIDKNTREMMKKYGRKDETYDIIIKRLVNIADRQLFFDKQKQILKEERFVPFEDI
ncbi:MAG: hypothetical protein HY831_01250 [Candidatus Aenigmarchaeota archaeon]|nr:hypothetical protein [Candidatus Aenigmarchaeota archaeon]